MYFVHTQEHVTSHNNMKHRESQVSAGHRWWKGSCSLIAQQVVLPLRKPPP